MEQISERTWLVLGATVGGGIFLLLYGALVFPTKAYGDMYVSISDGTRTINKVTEVSLTLERVELRSPGGGWVSVTGAPQTLELLALKRSGALQLVGQTRVPAGLYTEVRVTVGAVSIHT